MSDKALVKHLQRELERLESELKGQAPTFVSRDSVALLREKDLQIEQMEKEIEELTRQRDIAKARLESIAKTIVDEPASCLTGLKQLVNYPEPNTWSDEYPKNKTCPPQINNTSQSSSSLNNNNNNNRDENREVKQQSDHYLKQLNRASHKISKPIRRPPPPPLEPHHQQQQQDPQQQKQHQPPVYNINKSDFRDVVQKLTGSPLSSTSTRLLFICCHLSGGVPFLGRTISLSLGKAKCFF
ncbi:hypothetical protein Syun_025945 [Stephania yunnanensis]|uniref:VQ domain-containing protein n=1 Tax=Stephania yunnanensis TaxID=152371 RepID=A0AAP0EV91_9MAGN